MGKTKREPLIHGLIPKSKRVKRTPWSFSSKITQNKRSDGKIQSKVTLAKRFIDYVNEEGKFVEGTFLIQKNDEEMTMSFDKSSLPSPATLRELYSARWVALMCPFCGEPAPPPIFKKSSDYSSKILTHSCGVEYYCNLEHRDTCFDTIDKSRDDEKRWNGVIIHNYSPITGLVGYALHNDFDMMHPDSMLCHIIFRTKKSSWNRRLGYTTHDVHGSPVAIYYFIAKI